ncbi:MAG: F0F1 ATP synthase subunit B [Erysipelotrichaceae bacterium]
MDINIGNYLRLNVIDMVMVLVSTFLIVLVAKKFFWSKVLEYLDRREKAIATDLESAANEKAQAVQIKHDYEMQIANAKEEARNILDVAQSSAKAEKKETLTQAKLEADKIKEKAMQDIEREKISVRKEIKTQITEVAFLAAEKIVEKELDDKEHKKYVEDFIDHAGDSSWTA